MCIAMASLGSRRSRRLNRVASGIFLALEEIGRLGMLLEQSIWTQPAVNRLRFSLCSVRSNVPSRLDGSFIAEKPVSLVS